MNKANNVKMALATALVTAMAVNTWLCIAAMRNVAVGIPQETAAGTKLITAIILAVIGWSLGRMFLLRLVSVDISVADAVSSGTIVFLLVALMGIGFCFLSEATKILFCILFVLCCAFCLMLLWQLSRFGLVLGLLAVLATAGLTWYFLA